MKAAIIIIFFAISVTIQAQVPKKISYQAVIRNSSSQLVSNHAIGVKISILQGNANGVVVYTETQTPTTNANGLISIEIGGGAGFSDIDWANGPYFIKTETDPTGGTSYLITGTSQILTVPYALYATKAGNVNYKNGIRLPDSFNPNYDFIGNEGNFISFGHQGISEDFIGYKNNKFYFKDSPDGADVSDPDVIVGGKLGIGVDDPIEKFEINGNMDMHNNIVKNLATPVNEKDAATKAYVDKLIDQITELQLIIGIKLKDIDGNIYNTVTIGNQVWMGENLKATKYNDGAPINYPGTDNVSWQNNTNGAYAWFNNDVVNKAVYGALYNWHAVNTGKLCPTGWHVPTDAEWKTLEMAMGMSQITADIWGIRGTNEGSKLAGNAALWPDGALESNAAFGTSGFSALPGGYRSINGIFINIGFEGYWWSSTEYAATSAWARILHPDYSNAARDLLSKLCGISVRCMKD